MRFFHSLRQLWSRNSQTSRESSPRQKPLVFERLESREVLASSISIIDGVSGTGSLDSFLSATDGTINTADSAGVAGTVSSGALQAVNADVNISITAETTIIFAQSSTLALQTGTGNSATFQAIGNEVNFANTNNAITTAGGNLIFNANTSSSLGVLDAAGGNINVFAGIELLLYNNISTSGSGTIDLTAGTTGNDSEIVVAANRTISAAGGITLTADSLTINSGTSINSGSATTTIRPFDDGTLIDLGGADEANTLGLTDAELDRVTAGKIVIGRTSAGNVSVTANVHTLNTLQSEIVTGGSILSAGGVITETRLGLTAGTGIGVSGGSAFDILVANLEAATTSGGINISATANPIVIGGVSAALTGVSASSGNISITNTTHITVSEAVANSGGGNVSLNSTSGDLTINAAVSSTTGNGNISLFTGNNLAISAAVSTANSVQTPGTGTITITASALASIASTGSLSSQNGGISSTAQAFTNAGSISSGTGNIFFTAGLSSGTLFTNQGSISSTSGNVTNRYDDQDLQTGSTINVATNRQVNLRANTGGVGIDLGSNAVGLNFTQAELDTITAGFVRFTSAANITLSQSIVFDAMKVSTLVLEMVGGTVDGTATEQTDLTVTNLVLKTSTGIGDADDLDLAVSNLAFRNVTAGAVNISNTGALTINSIYDQFTSTNSGSGTTAISSTGALDFAVNTFSTGTLSLQSGSTITQTGGSITVGSGGVGSLAVESDGSVTLNNAGNAVGTIAALFRGTGSTFSYTDSNDLSIDVAGAITGITGIGNISVATVAGNLTVLNTASATDIVSSAGAITFTAGGSPASNFIVSAGASVQAAGNITFNVVNAELQAASQVTAIGTVTFNVAAAVDLGGSDNNTTPVLGLTNAELNTITANIIEVRITSADAMTVTSAIALTLSQQLFLRSGAGITQTASSTITVANLALETAGAIVLNEQNDVDVFGALVTDAGAGVQFTDSDALTIFFFLSHSEGVQTNGGAINISTTAGSLTLSEQISAGAAGITLTVGGSSSMFTNNAAISNTGGTNTIQIAANFMALSSGTISSGGRVYLASLTNARLIDLGSTTDVGANMLELSDAELDTITTPVGLQIGDANSSVITISAVISPLNYQTLDLQNGFNFATTGGFASDVTSATVFEKIVTNGPVTINTPASLSVTAIGGFVPAYGDSFTIIENTSISLTAGNFSGKPEGTLIAVGGVNKRITYGGGTDSNDVILQAIALPTVTSPTATNIEFTTATLGGNVTSAGDLPITDRGIIYAQTALNNNPQHGGVSVTQLTTTGTTGSFTINVSALPTGTQFSYVAYATSAAGTAYTAVSTFTTQPTIGQFPGITVQVLSGVLIVTGTEQNDTITITDGGSGVVVTSNQMINGNPTSQLFTGATSFVSNTLGGHDEVWLAAPLTLNGITIDLGAGNDRLVLGADPNNAINNNVLDPQFGTLGYLTVNGAVQVTGGEGNDRVLERSTNTNGIKTISLGEGDNEYNVYWGFSNETNFSSGSGLDNVFIGYLTARQASQFDTGAGNDLISYYASRFNSTAYLNSGAGADTVALDVNIYDSAATADTGGDADYLLFSRSVAFSSIALTTGSGVDTVLIGKYISGLNGSGGAIYSNGGSNIVQFTLHTSSGADAVQIAANVIQFFYANLGEDFDDADAEYNLFTDGWIDGGFQATRLRLRGNAALRASNFSI